MHSRTPRTAGRLTSICTLQSFHTESRTIPMDFLYRQSWQGTCKMSPNKCLEGHEAALHFRSHFGSSHFLFERARCLPVHERFWFSLVQVSTTSFVVFHLFSWQVLMMGPMCLSLFIPILLQMMVLLMVLALNSTELVTAQSMHSSRSSETFCHHSRVDSQIFDDHVKTLIEAEGVVTSRVTSVLNRPSMTLLPRWRFLQHWNRTSAPSLKMSALSLHVYARLKQMQPASLAPALQAHGIYLDTTVALQPLGLSGPMVQVIR